MMKKIYVLILLLFLTSSAFGFQFFSGKPPRNETAIPTGADAYYKFNSAGGIGTAQLYNEVTTSWEGDNADTGSFVTGYDGNAYRADSTDEYSEIPGSYFSSSTLTIIFRYRADNTGGDICYPLYLHNSFGQDRLYFTHLYENDGAADRGRLTIRTNTDTDAYYAVFTKPTDASWHQVWITIDMTNQVVDVYIDGADAVVSEANSASLDDWGTISDDVRIGYIKSYQASRYVDVDDLRIYDTIESYE